MPVLAIFILFVVEFAAWLLIFKYNVKIAKRRCQSWDGTKTSLLYSNIGNIFSSKRIPDYQVTQNREGLLASKDYEIILGQARKAYVEIIIVSLAIPAAFALTIYLWQQK